MDPLIARRSSSYLAACIWESFQKPLKCSSIPSVMQDTVPEARDPIGEPRPMVMTNERPISVAARASVIIAHVRARDWCKPPRGRKPQRSASDVNEAIALRISSKAISSKKLVASHNWIPGASMGWEHHRHLPLKFLAADSPISRSKAIEGITASVFQQCSAAAFIILPSSRCRFGGDLFPLRDPSVFRCTCHNGTDVKLPWQQGTLPRPYQYPTT